MASQPRPTGESADPPLAVTSGVLAEGTGRRAGVDEEILRTLNAIAAAPRSPGMSTTQLTDPAILAGVPQIRYLDLALLSQYRWPAGCQVERSPWTGRWVAWFTSRGCRYSHADLAEVHAIAVRAAPAYDLAW